MPPLNAHAGQAPSNFQSTTHGDVQGSFPINFILPTSEMSPTNADYKQTSANLDELSKLCNQADNGIQAETSSITPKVQAVGGRCQGQTCFYYQKLMPIISSKIFIWSAIVALCLCSLVLLGMGIHYFIANKIGVCLYTLTSVIFAALITKFFWHELKYCGRNEKPIHCDWIANVTAWLMSLVCFGLGIHFIIVEDVICVILSWSSMWAYMMIALWCWNMRTSDGSRIEWPQHCGLTSCSSWNLVGTKALRMIYPKKADTMVDIEA